MTLPAPLGPPSVLPVSRPCPVVKAEAGSWGPTGSARVSCVTSAKVPYVSGSSTGSSWRDRHLPFQVITPQGYGVRPADGHPSGRADGSCFCFCCRFSFLALLPCSPLSNCPLSSRASPCPSAACLWRRGGRDLREQTRKMVANCSKCHKGDTQVAEMENTSKGQREVRRVWIGAIG